MASSPADQPTDPDFDPPKIAWPPEAELARSRRLVVNPFLTALGLAAWAWSVAQISRGIPNPLAVFGLPLFFVAPALLQFHCLDCGHTGLLLAARKHACSGSLARWRRALFRRSNWPRLVTQLNLWFWGSVLITLTIVIPVYLMLHQE